MESTESEAPGQPVRPASAGASIWRLVAFLGVTGFTSFGAALVVYGGVLAYQYHSATPATATIDHCISPTEVSGGPGPETCYGRWSIGGVPVTGPIRGRIEGGHGVGSRVDVRVHGAKAYAASYAGLSYPLMAGGAVTIATGVFLWWFARRKYRAPSAGH